MERTIVAYCLVLLAASPVSHAQAGAPRASTAGTQGSAKLEVSALPSKLAAPSGVVLGPDGAPLGDAEVLLFHHVSEYGRGNEVIGTVRTDAKGEFAFKEPLTFVHPLPHSYAQDRYILIAVHPECAFGWVSIRPTAADTSYRISLTEPKTAVVRVRDRAGMPLAGALVRVQDAGSRDDPDPRFRDYLRLVSDIGVLTKVTDADGCARFTNLPDTSVSFVANLPGYAWQWTTGCEITLDPGATILGQVVDEAGTAVAGAVVQVYPNYEWHFFMLGETDVEGRFEIRDVPAKGWGGKAGNDGSYRLTLRHEVFAMPEQIVALEPKETREVCLKAVRGTKVRIRVLGLETAQPIPGARVGGHSVSGMLNGYTDANGVWETTVPPGQAAFSFYSPPDGMYVQGNQSRRTEQTLSVGTEPLDITLYPPGPLGRLLTLRGVVRLPGGTPAANVYIVQSAAQSFDTATFSGGSGSVAVTGQDGAFTFDKVAEGIPVMLYGVTPEQRFALARTILPSTGTAELPEPIVMQATRTVDVHVRDEGGNPRSGLQLRVTPSGPPGYGTLMRAKSVSVIADKEGRIRINGILPGSTYVLIDARADQSRPDWGERFFHTSMVLIPADATEGPQATVELRVPGSTPASP